MPGEDEQKKEPPMIDIQQLRADFPILDETVHGQRLVYLDNAATTQMPQQVLQAIADHYAHNNANVHRAVHELANRSTRALEDAREKVRAFINAPAMENIVLTGGTTDSINLVAAGLAAGGHLNGTTVVATHLEHHSNFVPWQQAALRTDADTRFAVAPLDARCDIDHDALEDTLERERVSIVAVTHVSNVTGGINDVMRVCELAHAHGAAVLVDAAQSAPHLPLDVQAMHCDFCAFSGHKMHALTGIGVLYVAPAWLDRLMPVRFGGEMVDRVATEESTFGAAPLRFEAGTPNYVGALSLGAAIDYLNAFDRTELLQREEQLTKHALERLGAVEGLHILGDPRRRTSVIAFTVDDVHPFDLSMMLDLRGIAVRSGTSCAQPLLNGVFGIPAMTRISLSFYNTEEEIDFAVQQIAELSARLRKARISQGA